MEEEQVELKCECGVIFSRPAKYEKWAESFGGVVFRWKIRYCEECYKARVEKAIMGLPKIIDALAK